MSIARADGWVAWYVETPEPPKDLDEYGSHIPRRMMSVPLVIWRELANGGVMGMVTSDADLVTQDSHLLTYASDLVIVGTVDDRTGKPRRFLFSHYARDDDALDR